MKFVCERCQTKYSIADDKVRQKVLKIRCKTCENVITIRDAVVVASSAAAAPPPAPPPRPATRLVEWHVAINGQQDGPFALSTVVSRVLGARKDEEVFIWNEHLDGWKEPKDVPEVAAELRARASALPPPVPSKRLPPPFHGGASRVGHAHHPVAAAGAGHMALGEGEDDRTQIQPLDAAMMMDAGPRSVKQAPLPVASTGSGAHAPVHAHAANGSGSIKSGLEGLDLRKPSSGGLFAAAAAAAGPVSAPVGASGLSQVAGLPRVMTRHPAIKYVAAGTVLVGLIVVIAVITMSDKTKAPKPSPIAAVPVPVEQPPPPLPPEPAKVAEHPVTAQVQPAAKVPVVGGRKPAPAGRAPANGKKTPGAPATAPPPVTATNIAPPPVGAGAGDGNDTGVARSYSPAEHKVPVVRRESAASSGNNGPDFDQAQFVAVINQQDHRAAVRSCYERALKRDDKLKVGRLEVQVDVGETGSVKKVSIEAPREFASVSDCIREVVRRWRFPAGAREYQGSFPLLLQGG